MPKVSVIIPNRNERFGQQTISDVLAKATGDIEVIVVLDGFWPDPPLKEDRRVIQLHKGDAAGMRPGINSAAAVAQGDYFLKLDAHCLVAQGFDEALVAACEPTWLVVPRRYSLDAERWAIQDNGKAPVDAHLLSYPFDPSRPGHGLHGQVWNERARARTSILVDDEMSSQGSCWFASRHHWETCLGPMNPAGYGNFVQEFQELGMKTWLSGGRVVVNKTTWYAHLHKGKEYGRGYFISKNEMSRGAKYCVDYWLNNRWKERKHDIRFLIEKFWPVPSWPTAPDGSLDWSTVEGDTAAWTQKLHAGEPVGM